MAETAFNDPFGELSGLVNRAWDYATARGEPPSLWVAGTTLGLALILVVPGPVRRRGVNYLDTLVHEWGHAVVGALFGHAVSGVRLHSDASGRTMRRYVSNSFAWIGSQVSSWSGYAAPAVMGTLTAWLTSTGRAITALWIVATLALSLLLLARTVFTAALVLATHGVLVALLLVDVPDVQAWCSALIAWCLVLSAARGAWLVTLSPTGSDAENLRDETGIPARFWGVSWITLTAVGAWMTVVYLFDLAIWPKA
ncbi:M50 family metallopeptidase [Streptoalloteichus hindustanus]|uniref:M50 family metallopeptidase n=1 Tax=Streptoalloteichus hindustanus TaxID=2017 RepID=UPI0009369BC0|nr:M50 family metallopeptidase [Streptoalloteichus hindustanus]